MIDYMWKITFVPANPNPGWRMTPEQMNELLTRVTEAMQNDLGAGVVLLFNRYIEINLDAIDKSHDEMVQALELVTERLTGLGVFGELEICLAASLLAPVTVSARMPQAAAS